MPTAIIIRQEIFKSDGVSRRNVLSGTIGLATDASKPIVNARVTIAPTEDFVIENIERVLHISATLPLTATIVRTVNAVDQTSVFTIGKIQTFTCDIKSITLLNEDNADQSVIVDYIHN